ncbi:MAG: capsular biosynthesis protein [Lachnospiraceae bacterium]|nr:capsular biosynthesis protein [Lachnospiraceae bacterium]
MANEMNEKKDSVIEIDLVDLALDILTKWKFELLITILSAILLFVYVAYLRTPMYESTSKLYVLSKSTSFTSLADIQTGTSLTNDYLVVVTDRPVLDKVISNLQLRTSYEILSDYVSVSNPPNSRILEITVKNSNPMTAKQIADEIASVASAFISEKMDQDPPSLISSGYADEPPIGLGVVAMTAIGALIGLVFAMGIVTLQYIFNDKVYTPEDMEKKVGLNTLSCLPLESEAEYN